MGFMDFLCDVIGAAAVGASAVTSISIESKKNKFLKDVTSEELSLIDLSARSISNDIDNDYYDKTAQFYREMYVDCASKVLLNSNDSENYNEDYENALLKLLIIIEKAFKLSGKNIQES